MIQNDTFKFVVHRENFLSVSQCQKLMRYLETGEPTESELAGNYDENILNKEVRDNKEVVINNKQLNDKLLLFLLLVEFTTITSFGIFGAFRLFNST